MPGKSASNIPLPKGWPTSVRSAMLQVIALAQFAMTYARGWAADSVNTGPRAETADDVEDVHPIPLGRAGGDRLHDHRSVDEGWIGNLLSAVRDEGGYTLGALCRMHGQSDGGVDDAGCPESGGNPCVTPEANPSYQVLSRPRFARRRPANEVFKGLGCRSSSLTGRVAQQTLCGGHLSQVFTDVEVETVEDEATGTQPVNGDVQCEGVRMRRFMIRFRSAAVKG